MERKMSRVRFANTSPVRYQSVSMEVHHKPIDSDMLHISPNDCMLFPRGDNSDSRIEITCNSKFPVTYKIQTTSPEKFRVRPRCGILRSGESITVQVLLKPEHGLSDSSRDKFLVMGFPLPDCAEVSLPQLTDLWKQKQNNSPDVEQHRLYCAYKGLERAERIERLDQSKACYTNAEVSESRDTSSVAEKQLAKQAKQLEKQLRFVQLLQCVTIIVLLLVLGAAAVYHLKQQFGNQEKQIVDDNGCPTGIGL